MMICLECKQIIAKDEPHAPGENENQGVHMACLRAKRWGIPKVRFEDRARFHLHACPQCSGWWECEKAACSKAWTHVCPRCGSKDEVPS
jgi:hypothetical protein